MTAREGQECQGPVGRGAARSSAQKGHHRAASWPQTRNSGFRDKQARAKRADGGKGLLGISPSESQALRARGGQGRDGAP